MSAPRGPASGRPVPLARVAGRRAGRWWRRLRPGVRAASQPARRAWAAAIAYGWFVGYLWVGLLLSAAAQRLLGGPAPAVSVVAVGGGGLLGWWQARHRLRAHADPATPALARAGLALCAWLGAIGAAMLLAT